MRFATLPGVPPTDQSAEQGQALPLVAGALAAVLLGAVVLGAVAHLIGVRGEQQRAADLAALAGARAMRDAYDRVFAPPEIGGRPNPAHLERAEYVALARRIALTTARRNGASDIDVTLPGDGLAPLRIRVTVRDSVALGPGATVASDSSAEAEIVPPSALGGLGAPGAGEYSGPLEVRQGKPMRPDVALAFDRMAAAAATDGVNLIVNSGFRTNAEQAALFAAHPDPKWVARPGQSLHRLGTELDLGPAAAYGWLSRNAGRFHFVQRYAWEPWHYETYLGSIFVNELGGDSAGSSRWSPPRRRSPRPQRQVFVRR